MADAEGLARDRYTEPRGKAFLWFGFLGGAAAWKLQLMVNYTLVPYACWHGLTIAIHVASLATFVLAAAAGWVALRIWRQVGGYPRDPSGYDREVSAKLGRTRFMSMAGGVMSPFFALVILAQWLPSVLLSPCAGIP